MYPNAEKYFYNVLKDNGYLCSFEEFKNQHLDAKMHSNEEQFMRFVDIYIGELKPENDTLKNLKSLIEKIFHKYKKKQFYFNNNSFSVHVYSKKHSKTEKDFVISFDFDTLHLPYSLRILYGYGDHRKDIDILFK
jgi:hypothetical protein